MSRAFWYGFRKGLRDPRLWAFAYPIAAAVELRAFAAGPSGWRWLALAFAVMFLIETGWVWRELWAVHAIRRRECTGRDLIIAAATVYAGYGRKDER